MDIPTIIVFIFGVFEFVQVARILLGGEEFIRSSAPIFADISEDIALRILICGFCVILGFQRLTWTVGGRSTLSWLCLVLTHICEGIMFWAFCLHQPSINPKHLDIFEFAVTVFSGAVDRKVTFVLIVVPLAVVLFGAFAVQDILSKGRKSEKQE
mmetsp:Transcript_7262/g.10254  ORF Transcript_7262/g.10254 Transcript_7262/m.10254 type:complete len:155 (+) Transcript_7262:11-475(+)